VVHKKKLGAGIPSPIGCFPRNLGGGINKLI